MGLLENLMEVSSPSGDEKYVRSLILKEIKKFVTSVKVDRYGNLIAFKKGKKRQPTVMLAAHMDEIGLMVKKITAKGYIKCADIGGFDATTLIGEEVYFRMGLKRCSGVITTEVIWNADESEERPTINDLIIDTGLSKKELKKKGIEVGSFIHLDKHSVSLGNKDFVCGKALDDRVGCYILLELAKKLKNSPSDVYFVFTVQEEVGLYGAKTSAYTINPDWAIAVDVTNANDGSEDTTKCLGDGPVIVIKDEEMLSNPCISKWLKDIAKKEKIKVQLEVGEFGTTDALNIALSRGGVPTGVVGVAVRNLHSPISVASKKDINNCINLLLALLKNPPKECVID